MSFRVAAVALWLVSALCVLAIPVAAIFKDVAQIPLLGNMLARPHLLDKATTIAILLVFGWALAELAIRTREVYRQHRAVPAFQATVANAELSTPQTFTVTVNTLAPRDVRRAHLIIDCIRRDPRSLSQVLPGAAALDANALAASYAPLHVYAWILPVLGFIGTASGMASAIFGFKGALIDAQNTQVLVSKLSELVIPGLAAAFETTMLALVASLVTYFCTSALRSWDQEALDALDRLSLHLFVGADRDRTAADEAVQLMVEAVKKLSTASGELQTASLELQTANRELRASISLPYHVTITRGDSK